MDMVGEQLIAAPRQRVWEALNDPDILAASLPGHQHISKEADDHFVATVDVKIGPIGARLKGSVTLTDLNPPHSYTIIMQGHGGIAGSMKGIAKVRLDEVDTGTLMNYEVDAQVAGRMAQLGGPIIDATAKQYANRFFDSFRDIVSGEKAMPPRPEDIAAARPAIAAPAARPAGGFPAAWILAVVVAAICGFLFGHDAEAANSAWAGLAAGLLVILVAGVAFEYGRRSAAPVVTLDAGVLRRLLDGDRR